MTRDERMEIARFCREQGIDWQSYGENVIVEFEAAHAQAARWVNSYVITGMDHLISTIQSIQGEQT